MSQQDSGQIQTQYENEGGFMKEVESKRVVSEDTSHYILIKGIQVKEATSTHLETLSVGHSTGPEYNIPDKIHNEMNANTKPPSPEKLKTEKASNVAGAPPSPRTLLAIQAAMLESSSEEEPEDEDKRKLNLDQATLCPSTVEGNVSPRTLQVIQQALSGGDDDVRAVITASADRTQMEMSGVKDLISSSDEVSKIKDGKESLLLPTDLSTNTVLMQDDESDQKCTSDFFLIPVSKGVCTPCVKNDSSVEIISIDKEQPEDEQEYTSKMDSRSLQESMDISMQKPISSTTKTTSVAMIHSETTEISNNVEYENVECVFPEAEKNAPELQHPLSVTPEIANPNEARVQRKSHSEESDSDGNEIQKFAVLFLSTWPTQSELRALSRAVTMEPSGIAPRGQYRRIVSMVPQIRPGKADLSANPLVGWSSFIEVDSEISNDTEFPGEIFKTSHAPSEPNETLAVEAAATELEKEEDDGATENLLKDAAEEVQLTIHQNAETKKDREGAVNEWQDISLKELEALENNLSVEQNMLQAQKQQQERIAATVTGQMFLESQELLRLFGVPYIEAPMEAEAQCAVLDLTDQTSGTITDDSDIWLFGARHVYKNFFNQNKYVEYYQYVDIQNQLGKTQLRIDSFFRLAQHEKQAIKSQRLRRAVTCMRRKEKEAVADEIQEATAVVEREFKHGEERKGKIAVQGTTDLSTAAQSQRIKRKKHSKSKEESFHGGGFIGEVQLSEGSSGSSGEDSESEVLNKSKRGKTVKESAIQKNTVRQEEDVTSSSSGEGEDEENTVMVTARSVFEGKKGKSWNMRGRKKKKC
ncbi:DNA repair protein complementing XP-G cells like protein [Chelonia mydas]|uniref:DNA repair protein complementing XP-G cells like protein n=1 Tax=Chelonia mydas TaxID=8469 RepID=M7BCA7_CHEMY|nr:DNA repair protein complementing XP-G cells like protein [Chelonia mydas]